MFLHSLCAFFVWSFVGLLILWTFCTDLEPRSVYTILSLICICLRNSLGLWYLSGWKLNRLIAITAWLFILCSTSLPLECINFLITHNNASVPLVQLIESIMLRTRNCHFSRYLQSFLENARIQNRVIPKDISNSSVSCNWIYNRGCQSWTIYYLSSSFLFCKYNLYFQTKSDWSKHKILRI